MRRGDTNGLYAIIKLLIGVAVLIVIIMLIAKIRNSMLAKDDCDNPIRILTNEVSSQAQRATVGQPAHIIMPLGLQQECYFEASDKKICGTHGTKSLPCKKIKGGAFASTYTIAGRNGVTRVEITATRDAQGTTVVLGDVSR
ncbi:MAG: hypothetical protein V1735_03655 [Nanoarchaeota archaeon]